MGRKGENSIRRTRPMVKDDAIPSSAGCLFIVGKAAPGDLDPPRCGERRKTGSPYCLEHHALCYRKPEEA